MLNSISGFQTCGIHPFNPDIFPKHLYQSSKPTDCPIEEVVSSNNRYR